MTEQRRKQIERDCKIANRFLPIAFVVVFAILIFLINYN